MRPPFVLGQRRLTKGMRPYALAVPGVTEDLGLERCCFLSRELEAIRASALAKADPVRGAGRAGSADDLQSAGVGATGETERHADSRAANDCASKITRRSQPQDRDPMSHHQIGQVPRRGAQFRRCFFSGGVCVFGLCFGIIHEPLLPYFAGGACWSPRPRGSPRRQRAENSPQSRG